ncbi:MAG: DUF86 domain-containing protein [Dechloromonas sp.]|nr:MAG: DUF86 domain-containing protein [Dechloromonas sp.]
MTRNPHRFHDRIEDILEAIGNVRSDLGGMSQAEFLSDGKTQRAIIESLIVIGEAATKVMQINPAIQQEIPALWQQFRDASDMRNILTHEYFRVDAAIVWTTVLIACRFLRHSCVNLGRTAIQAKKGSSSSC